MPSIWLSIPPCHFRFWGGEEENRYMQPKVAYIAGNVCKQRDQPSMKVTSKQMTGEYMSTLQQLPRSGAQLQERPYRLEERVRKYEASLLSELFRRNGREERVQTATSPGYSYTQDASRQALSLDASGPIMQVAAHPGDGPDFFYATSLKIASNTQYRNSYHEVVLTDGEGGVDGWHPERTRQVRMKEAYAGVEIVGSRLHFLSSPDGGLSELPPRKKTRLVRTLARKIGEIQPAILVVHPPKQDHPDHASSFFLTIAALEVHAQAGGRAPTLLIHDVEFGLQQHSLWTSPAPDPLTETYSMHVPSLLVDVTSTHQDAQHALQKHQTQMVDPMLGQPKLYGDLIDTLAHVRGLQFMAEDAARIPRGQGFSQVIIPGLTSEYTLLPQRLPAGSLYKGVPTFFPPVFPAKDSPG
jgi:LmbE family N-acetylglucosaminyl deacetylase